MMNRHEISEADLNTAMYECDYDPEMHNYPDESYDCDEWDDFDDSDLYADPGRWW